MRLRIVSDGTGYGTQLLDADTGEKLNLDVSSISWHVRARDQIAEAVLIVPVALVDVIGEGLQIGELDEAPVPPPTTETFQLVPTPYERLWSRLRAWWRG